MGGERAEERAATPTLEAISLSLSLSARRALFYFPSLRFGPLFLLFGFFFVHMSRLTNRKIGFLHGNGDGSPRVTDYGRRRDGRESARKCFLIISVFFLLVQSTRAMYHPPWFRERYFTTSRCLFGPVTFLQPRSSPSRILLIFFLTIYARSRIFFVNKPEKYSGKTKLLRIL